METKTNFESRQNVALAGTAPSVSMEEVAPLELAKGITTEEMKADYFNSTILHEPAYQLHQLNSRGKRYYYIFDGDEPVFFPSVTTVLHNVMPENKFLTEWKLSLGKEKAESVTMEKARYGTFLHAQMGKLMIAGSYDLETLRDTLCLYAEKENLPVSFVDMYEEEAKADLLAFAKWLMDYEVEPLAVEVALYSPMHGYAGCVDCVCTMREFPKGDTRKKAQSDNRITAIVDFKSGKKGFYDEYAIQLEMYRMMWNENFPEIPIERTFNLAPKDWRGTVKKIPSYSFEEQTENPVINRTPLYIELFKLMDEESRKITVCGGMIDLKEDVLSNVDVLELSDLVKKGREKESDDPSTLFGEEE